MKFIDHANITVTSGQGGSGSRHFRREKHVPRGGPDGGDGGRGGDVRIVASNRARSLYEFHVSQHYRAEDGAAGGEKRATGRAGADLVLTVPPGTAIYDEADGALVAELLAPGAAAVLAAGGNGGWGNWRFRRATRQAPEHANPGLPGVTRRLRLELRLLADVALVGLPNVGKSSLIRAVSASKAEVADYPFTTLIPNLGVVTHRGRSFTVADVPGLVEGAATGAGLGVQFLRHVQRCSVIVVVLDPSQVMAPETQYEVLHREIVAFEPALWARPRIVLLGKADTVADPVTAAAELARAIGLAADGVQGCSAVTGRGVRELLDALLSRLPAGDQPDCGPWLPLEQDGQSV